MVSEEIVWRVLGGIFLLGVVLVIIGHLIERKKGEPKEEESELTFGQILVGGLLSFLWGLLHFFDPIGLIREKKLMGVGIILIDYSVILGLLYGIFRLTGCNIGEYIL